MRPLPPAPAAGLLPWQQDAHKHRAQHQAWPGGQPLTLPLSLCSLSELREYSEGLGEPAACTPAPVPGQSVLSLLSTEELRKFIEEVKELDAATLKVGSHFWDAASGDSVSPLRPPSAHGEGQCPGLQRDLPRGALSLGCSSCKAQFLV